MQLRRCADASPLSPSRLPFSTERGTIAPSVAQASSDNPASRPKFDGASLEIDRSGEAGPPTLRCEQRPRGVLPFQTSLVPRTAATDDGPRHHGAVLFDASNCPGQCRQMAIDWLSNTRSSFSRWARTVSLADGRTVLGCLGVKLEAAPQCYESSSSCRDAMPASQLAPDELLPRTTQRPAPSMQSHGQALY